MMALAVRRRSDWALAAPAVVLLVAFSIYPFLFMLYGSFTESTLGRPFSAWIGLNNYREALTDRIFLDSTLNTLAYGFGVTIATLVIGFVLALFLHRSLAAGRYLRSLILLPFVAPPVSVAMIWRLIYAPTSGLLNHYLQQVGATTDVIPFLGQSSTALISIMVIDVWQWTPFVFILALAGLQSLDPEPFEVARVDGASRWQAFRYLTLPMVLPIMIGVGIIRLIIAFKVFDLVFMLTGGGPGTSTQVTSHYIYRTAFSRFDTGYASSMTVLLLIAITLIISILMLLHGKVSDRYEG